MSSRGRPYPLSPQPWDEIRAFFDDVALKAAGSAHMTSIPRSVLDEGGTQWLAGATSMHDLIVGLIPISDVPGPVIVVRAPGSVSAPAVGQVRIEYLPVAGRATRIDRPVEETVPLFWRFVHEEFGVRVPAR